MGIFPFIAILAVAAPIFILTLRFFSIRRKEREKLPDNIPADNEYVMLQYNGRNIRMKASEVPYWNEISRKQKREQIRLVDKARARGDIESAVAPDGRIIYTNQIQERKMKIGELIPDSRICPEVKEKEVQRIVQKWWE